MRERFSRPVSRPVLQPVSRPVPRPVPRGLRLGGFYALSGLALALSALGLVVVGGMLLYFGPFALRSLPDFLHPHPANGRYGFDVLGWLFGFVALVISAALTVVFLYLLFVVGVSVVMLLRQLLSTLHGKEPPEHHSTERDAPVSLSPDTSNSNAIPPPPQHAQHPQHPAPPS